MTEFERKSQRISAWQYQAPPLDSPVGIQLNEHDPGWLVAANNAGKVVAEKFSYGWCLRVSNVPEESYGVCVSGEWVVCDNKGDLDIISDSWLRENYDQVQ